MSITEKSAFAQTRRNWSSRIRALHRDRKNCARYGPEAPLFAERLWVPLDRVAQGLKLWSSRHSGQVVDDWPVAKVRNVRELPAIKACLAHWCDGLPWEETGIHRQMLDTIAAKGKVDRLRNAGDVRRRYQELDALFLQVKQAGRLKVRSELVPGNFREEGGVLFHVGPDGKPFFAGKGHHRLAIAFALRLPFLPAQVGCVHRDGINYLRHFRVSPEE